ncbi:MAG TPA: S-methyl-5'-thioadenosine phosphorylase [Candidatus Bathyarchaeia archaeon]|nr:S-methyl-5'-thioadenosine phosphorylase [Candidatus Bathyarchaeia archaeon]
MQAEIGIIGGTGLYDPKLLRNVEEITLDTPYGAPSDAITVGELGGRRVAFLPRHGKKHTIRPTDVNSRANIFALKKLGVQWILAPSTVGSLREEYKPGDIVFVDQFIDRTTRREQSFYTEKQVCHISVAEPMCPELRRVLIAVAKDAGISAHSTGTYVCIEGPRFSTKAESKMFRSWGADVVGMTLVPECVLAREAEMCYASIATVTDYDVWKDHVVCVDDIVKTMRANIENVKHIIVEAVAKLPNERGCECGSALKSAFV